MTPSRAPLRIACALAALCALPAAAASTLEVVSSEPDSILLGTAASVRIKVRAPGHANDLQSLVPSGELTRVAGDTNQAEFSWTPPATKVPQVAIVVFFLANDPQPPDVAVTRVALVGKLDLEVNTDPGAQVRVQVGSKTFGPRRADSRGRVKVPVEVPPTAREAQVLGEVRGKTSTAVSVPLEVPRTNPLAAFVSPDPMVKGEPAWLWVFDSSARTGTLELSAKGAKVRPERSEGDRSLYRLDAESARRVTVNLSVKNVPEATLQLSTAVLNLVVVPVQQPPSGGAVHESRPEVPSGSVASRLIPSVLVGGFYGGGANLGPSAALGVGVRLPWWEERLVGELELGVREASFTTEIAGLGSLGSTLWALPVTLGGRARLLQAGEWSVDGRLGGGVMPVVHATRGDFQPAYTESGLTGVGFAAATAGYRVGDFELVAELRGQWSPVNLAHLTAQLGGFGVSVGLRHARP